MPNPENLRSFRNMPQGEHLLISKRGGKVKSMNKSVSASMRWIKNRISNDKELTEDQKQNLIQKISNRESLAASVLVDLEKYKKTLHPSQRVALANTEIKAGEFLHGSKVQQESINLNVSITIEEWEKRLINEDEEETTIN